MLLLLLSFFPAFLVAVWSFYSHTTSNLSNYGNLLHPPLQQINFSKDGSWRLCMLVDKNCDSLCSHQLFLLRQMRLGMGQKSLNLDRVVFSVKPIVWPHDSDLYKGVQNINLRSSEFDNFHVSRGIYLVDPSGFVVMSWPSHPDPRLLMEDLDKIMKFY
ncbi:hypothetical protein [Candidatus Ichthyocystis sparus]|uniref:hypothetical protein n=1 Tax=Candidatus Ichthyocystis sparus TaxID=1561004 RepID=UPI000B889C3D|nr:hypothetical protein [Candidatus Ichthyocystis sparus]